MFESYAGGKAGAVGDGDGMGSEVWSRLQHAHQITDPVDDTIHERTKGTKVKHWAAGA